MKRMLVLAAIAALVLPAAALAKGPSKATITGPGLAKAITIAGTEEAGSPLMTFAEEAGFFPSVFAQTPDPMLAGRPEGDLGPKYRIDWTVPGADNDLFSLKQDLYPYADLPVTYMKPGQKIFTVEGGTRGGWYRSSSALKDTFVKAGLPEKEPATTSEKSSSAGFFSNGRLGALVGVLLLLGAATMVMRRRFRRGPAA